MGADGICVLSDDRLMMSNFYFGAICLYNSEIELIRKIEKIDENTFKPNVIATNGTDRIYMSDVFKDRIIMTDFDFKLLNTYELPKFVSGLCYANNLLYICDQSVKSP